MPLKSGGAVDNEYARGRAVCGLLSMGKVSPCPEGEQITNGEFGTGDFTGWTNEEAAWIIGSNGYVGSYYATTESIGKSLEQSFATPILSSCFSEFSVAVKNDYVSPGCVTPEYRGILDIEIVYSDDTSTLIEDISYDDNDWHLIDLLSVLEAGKKVKKITVKGALGSEEAIYVGYCTAHCPVPPPPEDFTTYTEVDPNSHLFKTAYHVDHTGYRNEDCYLYKDKGASHFGDFTHLIDFKPVDRGFTAYGWSVFWMLSVDTVDDWKGLKDAGKTSIGAECQNNSGTPGVYLVENYGSTLYQSSSILLVYGTQYYCKIVKSGTSLTLHVYSDASRTTEVSGSPVSLTLHADHKCQYIFVGNTYNDGTDADKWIDVDIDNLDLQEAG